MSQESVILQTFPEFWHRAEFLGGSRGKLCSKLRSIINLSSFLGVVFLSCFAHQTATAQDQSPAKPDTLIAIPDSLGLSRPDTSRAVIRLTWENVVLPYSIKDSAGILGSHTRAKDPVEIFADRPGYFRYQQGGFGQPSHLSPYHLSPASIGFRLDGASIEDPLTGLVDWDFVPLDYAIHEMESRTFSGRAIGLSAASRLIENEGPYTEMKYFTGSNGLQAITAIHSQNRQRKVFGQDALLNTSVHYRGGAADGEFTNSNYRHREIGARILLASSAWYFALDLKSGNHRNGINGGVVQRGTDYETIFDRFGASVNSSSDRRTKKRSQIKADLGFRWREGLEPLRTSVYWQSNLNRYFSDTTFVAHTQTTAFLAEQALQVSDHRIQLALRLERGSPGTTSIWQDATEEIDLSVRDNFEIAGSEISVGVSLGRFRGLTTDASHISIEKEIPGFDLTLNLRSGKRPLATRGRRTTSSLGIFQALSLTTQLSSRDQMIGLGLGRRWNALNLGLRAYVNRSERIDFTPILSDTNSDVFGSIIGSSDGGGLGIDLSWNRMTQRGLYLSSQIDLFGPDADGQFRGSIPKLTTRSEVGARYSIFQRELVMDSKFEFRSQSESRLLGLYGPTSTLGSLVNTRTIGSQAQLNFWTDAEIRGATIFIGVENILAPWLDAGSVSLDPYPLPDIGVRVGLLWPMDG